MVVKGINIGNKRKIDDVLPSLSTTTSASPIPTPQSSPKILCPPATASPPIAKLNTIPRPRAQRKFAQGVVIPSPPVTPYKVPKTVTPVKKVRIPQYSPPIKRPKTEDFLTFLCYRGTSALPKSLNFFNYPSHYDRVTDFVKVKSRNELKSWRKDSNPATTTQVSSTASSSTQRSQGQGGSDPKPNHSQSKSAQKQTPTAKINKINIEAINKKAEKDKGGSKVVKKSMTQSTTVSSSIIVPLPKRTHINEQDAKFAISALKLKYQEKRLANTKPTVSVASKLAKKVKERRVILTRSKSRDDDIEIETSFKSNPKISKSFLYSTQELSRRNAPSPDIIDGVKLKQQIRKDSSSSEESSSSSSDEDCSKSSKCSKASRKEDTKKGIRSLRSGRKPIIIKTSRPSKLAMTSKSAVLKRISTRASRRNSTSPLRELPMYGILKKRKKKLKRDKSPGRKKKSDKKETEQVKSSPVGETSRRPSRKTKESAAFFLNLITKNFSSDENENDEKSEGEQSEGDTSSSETKFLENRYKAIMKRDEQKGSSKKSKNEKAGQKEKKTCNLTTKKKSRQDVKQLRPGKRILRSESIRRKYQRKAASPITTRNSRRRATVPISPVEKLFHAGAARKSASVFPRKNKRSSSSSSSSSSSDDSSSSSSSSNSGCEEDKAKKPALPKRSAGTKAAKNVEVKTRKAKQPARKVPKTSDKDDASGQSESDDDKPPPRQRSFSTCVTEDNLRPSEDDEQRTKSECSSSSTISDSDSETSSTEDEEIVEKVEIAIQVDMDLEESLEQEAAAAALAAGQQTDSPHFMSQGCQSEFPAPRSSPVHIPRPHHQPVSPIMTHPPQPPQMSHPQPPLLPFPGQNFYPALGNFEFISQRTQQDFSVMLPTIVPTVSTYSFGPSTVLTHNQIPTIPIGYSTTSISAATTLQTHIRSVAANLDIPLVRPVVSQTNLLPLTRPSQQMDPHRPLTRPVMNSWPDQSQAVRTTQSQNPQQHYSAFRVPVSTVISGSTMHQRLMQPPVSNLHYVPQPYPQQQRFQAQQPIGTHLGTNPNRASSGVSGAQGQRPQNANMASTVPGISAHGLSLIQSLPNVSIVPKFDRTVKTVLIRPEQQPTSSSTPEISKKVGKAKDNNGPPKEKGRKRKILPFTKAPSPLLVRKDSTNPITYVGTASKKNLKGKEHENPTESLSPPTTINQFNKLIQQNETAQERINMAATCPESESIPSTPSVTKKSSNGIQNSFQNPVVPGPDTEKCTSPKALKDPDKLKASKRSTDSESLKSERSVEETKSKKDLCKTKSRKSEDKLQKSKKSKEAGEKLKGKKSETRTESPRAASVSSERSRFSERSSESQDSQEIKLEDILAYYPTDEEFQDPLKYIAQIQDEAQRYGIARIVPPKSFRPECNVEDDMRFTAYNHYIHRMHKRWGPNVHVRVGIMENLKKSKVRVTASNPPMIGGMEVDLTTLYHTVQSFGGLTEVIQKDKWNKVSDAMNFPKAANGRASKLDAIYVKYVLPYEMLSETERKKLLGEVDKKWKIRLNRDPESEIESDEDDPLLEAEDCIIKGKSTPLSSYYRVARNTMSMLFKSKEPSHSEVESAYWKLVRDRDRHLCVYSGSIDCAGLGWGFPLPKGGTKHPWNLKVLANNPGSILKSMGSVMGATVPTLHVGMVFTTYCWYRDPHNLPWVEYLHSGGNKIWYVIPSSHEANFRRVLKELMPRQCKDKKIWLTSDSAMVPPELLLSQGIPLFRAVQNPGEFLVVFPKAFTSAICTGYVISESVCFASPEWLHTSTQTFQDIRDSKEPPVFPLEKLLLSILIDSRVTTDILKMALPVAERMFNEELTMRKKLRDLGVGTGKMTRADEKGKRSKKNEDNDAQECETCNYVLHLSMVTHKSKKLNYCLPHAIQQLSKTKSKIKASSLLYDETDAQLRSILEAAQSRSRSDRT